MTPYLVNKAEAIDSLVPAASWTMRNDTDIEWLDSEKTEPTEAEIDAEIIRLQAAYDALEYARKREAEYPTVAELTISLFDAADKAALVTKRAAVKTKWPKDNSGPIA